LNFWHGYLVLCWNWIVAYLVVADEEFGRQIPFAFLERVKEDFRRRYQGGRADMAVEHSLDREFGPRLKEHMEYCTQHPEEMDKMAKIKSQVAEVKGIMMENIEQVLDRGGKIEVLVDKSETLRNQVLSQAYTVISFTHLLFSVRSLRE
jgi:vesicle-associated membrane protein 72